MDLCAAFRVGDDLGDATSFVGKPADQLSIVTTKPVVRRAHGEPGLHLHGLVFSQGFRASQHQILLVPGLWVLGFKLQLSSWFGTTLRYRCRLVWQVQSIWITKTAERSSWNFWNRKGLQQILLQFTTKIAVFFFQWLIKLVLFIFIWWWSDRFYQPEGFCLSISIPKGKY